jgi:small subunit ribosomal protein S4
MGLAPSRRGARQMVSHGHFIVNDHRVTVPSYALKVGDVIKVREGSKGSKLFSDLPTRLKDYKSPAWISFDVAKTEGKVLEKPKNTETFLDLNAVLEFYSR